MSSEKSLINIWATYKSYLKLNQILPPPPSLHKILLYNSGAGALQNFHIRPNLIKLEFSRLIKLCLLFEVHLHFEYIFRSISVVSAGKTRSRFPINKINIYRVDMNFCVCVSYNFPGSWFCGGFNILLAKQIYATCLF